MASSRSTFFRVISGNSEDRLQIIWLHGWGQTHASLLPLAELMEKRAANILFDLPGFGATERLETGATTVDYAAALGEELSPLQAGKRILVGHSFGCRIALRLAAQRPELVTGLVLIAPAGLPIRRGFVWRLKSTLLKLIGRTARFMDRHLGTRLHDRFALRFGSADYRSAGPLRETFIKVVNEDLAEVAMQINQPVEIVVGEADSEAPPEISRRYEQLIEKANLSVLPGFGHLDILARGRHQLEARLSRFIKEHGLGQ
jgi:pimeloyl-ACP methyl ester carboxylesterase